ncbi:MAG: hypothetical protein NTY80_03275 [candidate division SR1 bacterium]|nr:hypothetical protein [candidate division SR1 bacterium]
MLNKQRSSIQKPSGLFNKAFVTTALLFALNSATHAFAQSRPTDKSRASITLTASTSDAASFAMNNVDTYYPDMKEHLDTLLSNFWNEDQRNAVDSLLNEHIMKNISDPKQRTAAIIYCIEKYAYLGSDKIQRRFSQLHVKDIDKDNAQFIFRFFGKAYLERFNGYYSNLQKILQDLQAENAKYREENMQDKKEIEQDRQKIENLNKQIDGIINQFTVSDVKTKPDIKELVLKTEASYIKHKDPISSHLAELINAAKQ